jgi:tetratricopeptide (TPR) repeat protein
MTALPAHRRALSIALFAAVALLPLAAGAQATDAQKKEAREINDKATRLYEVGRYEEAIAEYQKVYLIVDDPVLLYNIAQSYRLWGKPEDAVRFYRNYLRRSPSASNRPDVEKKIADLDRTIEERRRSPVPPTTSPPVTAPTTEAPPPPPTQVAPPPAATTVQPPPVTVVQPVTEPTGESHTGARIVGYGLLGGASLVLVGSAVAGAVAKGKSKDLEKMSNDPLKPIFDPSIEKSGKTANAWAIGLGVAGVALAAAGTVVLLTTRSSSSVAVYPVVGPQLAGGGARVTF